MRRFSTGSTLFCKAVLLNRLFCLIFSLRHRCTWPSTWIRCPLWRLWWWAEHVWSSRTRTETRRSMWLASTADLTVLTRWSVRLHPPSSPWCSRHRTGEVILQCTMLNMWNVIWNALETISAAAHQQLYVWPGVCQELFRPAWVMTFLCIIECHNRDKTNYKDPVAREFSPQSFSWIEKYVCCQWWHFWSD